uniref:WbqC family protein n=1 Tax=Roseihalotalea indica TaxID=2867963 RepID=A0AA49JD76_9BACT|nr:WbqC family protein [Tunicatimonas sp. TK19036]
MDTIALVESYYLPCLAYFASIRSSTKILLDNSETYIKQSYRNRCYILGANKIQPLSVPVHRGSGKVCTKDVRVAYGNRWQNNHWRSIASAYGKTPFFAHFADEFHDILFHQHKYLIDLNVDLLSKCLELLQWKHTIHFCQDNDTFIEKKPINDYRGQIQISETKFKNYQFQPIQYMQAFGKDFAPNLSIIDLLFCEGPRADYIIQHSLIQR